MQSVSLASALAVATFGVGVSFLSVGQSSTTQPAAPTANAEGAKLLGRVPTAFVPNLGQWERAARYVARFGAMTVFLEQKWWTFTLVQQTTEKETRSTTESAATRGVAVRMTITGASEPTLVAEDQLPGRHNYFLGNDPSKWRSDVPLYASVLYREVRPGIDVRAREHDQHFEYDLLLQPDADLDPVEITVEGIERMHIDGEALVLETSLGPVRMPAPLSWEAGPSGERSLINCRYVLRGENRFGFEVIGRRPGWALTVDPGLVWSTFLGGTGNDRANALAVDAQGAATVAGSTTSFDFPTTLGAFDPSFNGGAAGDAFVTRLSPTGSSLVYSTFLGGTGLSASVGALALDAEGAATVAGATTSSDFPTTPGAFDRSYNGSSSPFGGDAFVTRLDMLPTGVTAFGRSSSGCTGPLAITVTSMPQVGSASFALTCGNAPPSTSGLLALTGNAFANPVVLAGAEIWVDPTLVFIQLPASSNTVGASEVNLPIPNDSWLCGTRLFAQFFWAGPTSPPPCPPQGLSASNALEFTIQP